MAILPPVRVLPPKRRPSSHPQPAVGAAVGGDGDVDGDEGVEAPQQVPGVVLPVVGLQNVDGEGGKVTGPPPL